MKSHTNKANTQMKTVCTTPAAPMRGGAMADLDSNLANRFVHLRAGAEGNGHGIEFLADQEDNDNIWIKAPEDMPMPILDGKNATFLGGDVYINTDWQLIQLMRGRKSNERLALLNLVDDLEKLVVRDLRCGFPSIRRKAGWWMAVKTPGPALKLGSIY